MERTDQADQKSCSRGAIVITGASTGIGKACALRLATVGFQVFAGVRRETDGAALVQATPSGLTPLQLDVTDAQQVAAAAAMVEAAVGRCGIAGLVNNAGVAVGGPLEFLPMEVLEQQMDVNFFGAIRVTQAFVPLLRRASGRIVNMSSVAGRSALPFIGPYSASKFALEAVSDALRLELRPWQIHVALVEPGSVATPIWQKGVTMVDQMRNRLPEQAHRLYGPLFPFLHTMLNQGMANQAKANSIDAVANAVEHALTAKQPKIRYRIGRGTHLRMMLESLPTRWRDAFIASRLPRYGPKEENR